MGIFRFGERSRRRGAFVGEADRAASAAAASGCAGSAAVTMRIFRAGKHRRRRGAFVGEAHRPAPFSAHVPAA